MGWSKNQIDLSILNRVLPEFDPISAGEAGPDIQYKAIDSRTGDIFLISHPSHWKTEIDMKGNHIKIRPIPELKMTYDEACKAAQRGTAAEFRSSRRSKKEDIFSI